MVAALAESAAEQGRKVLIVTNQNSAADSAVEKLKESKYMVVRAHSLGLERRTMLQANAKASKAEDVQEHKASDEPPVATKTRKKSLVARLFGRTKASSEGKTAKLLSNDLGKKSETTQDPKSPDGHSVEPEEQNTPSDPQDQNDDPAPDHDSNLDEAPDKHMVDLVMRANTDFMQACENVYLARESVLRPVDPRMQKVQFAIHT